MGSGGGHTTQGAACSQCWETGKAFGVVANTHREATCTHVLGLG